eukprot:COSAG01_NODE_8417_length_2789_cov_3.643866_3_plen_655_part_01
MTAAPARRCACPSPCTTEPSRARLCRSFAVLKWPSEKGNNYRYIRMSAVEKCRKALRDVLPDAEFQIFVEDPTSGTNSGLITVHVKASTTVSELKERIASKMAHFPPTFPPTHALQISGTKFLVDDKNVSDYPEIQKNATLRIQPVNDVLPGAEPPQSPAPDAAGGGNAGSPDTPAASPVNSPPVINARDTAFKIFVRNCIGASGGPPITVDVAASTTVAELKKEVQAQLPPVADPPSFYLKTGTRILQDDKMKMSDYSEIKPDVTLQMHLVNAGPGSRHVRRGFAQYTARPPGCTTEGLSGADKQSAGEPARRGGDQPYRDFSSHEGSDDDTEPHGGSQRGRKGGYESAPVTPARNPADMDVEDGSQQLVGSGVCAQVELGLVDGLKNMELEKTHNPKDDTLEEERIRRENEQDRTAEEVETDGAMDLEEPTEYKNSATPLTDLTDRPPRRPIQPWLQPAVSRLAINSGDDATICALVKEGVWLDETDESGQTLLHLAINSGDDATICALVKEGASLDETDQSGQTLLHLAMNSGDDATICELVEAGVWLKQTDESGQTLLHLAMNSGDDATIRALVEAGVSLKQTDESGQTLLHLAMNSGDDATICALVKEGASLRQTDESGTTLLHLAINSGDDATICALVKEGASLTQANE